LNHFRPLVDWKFDTEEDEAVFEAFILGPLYQMTSLMLHENRAHLSHMNAIGELCAQFRSGILAMIRKAGADSVIQTVEKYHKLHPAAADACWYPDTFANIDTTEWQQLYVNAEHDGRVGVVAISRESYNSDVNRELNSAIDWLKGAGIDRVILTGDFHLSTQLVGADTSEFYPALEDTAAGAQIAGDWSRTARRLNDEFEVSVGFVNGKRCLGGMLELMMHCHYLVAVDDAKLGMPEVTLPVVPGMEGCHWSFRKAQPDQWPMLFALLLSGNAVSATDAAGWLVDYVGSMDDALKTVWKIATDGDHGITKRTVQDGSLSGMPTDISGLPAADSPATEAARSAIMKCIQDSCGAALSDAAAIQARHSAEFMVSPACKGGAIGADYAKTMLV
jgi:enoyl-CoA hydratase/carnithine racemase